MAVTKVAADKQKELSEFWILFEVRANGSNKLNTQCEEKVRVKHDTRVFLS